MKGVEVCKLFHEKLHLHSPVHLKATIAFNHPVEEHRIYHKGKSAYLKRFRFLRLSLKVHGDDDKLKFLNFLPADCELISLDIRGNHIGAEGVRLLISRLPDLGNLSELWLGDNRLSVQGMRLLATTISASNNHMTHLSLEKNGLGGLDMEAMRILVTILPLLASLIVLNLGENKLGIEGARLLSDCLGTLSKLQVLDLSNNWLREEGIHLLVPSLASLRQLRTINLANNRLGPEAIRALSAADTFGSLHDLNLEFNQLGPEGVRLLSSALASASAAGSLPLERLNLLGNEMGAGGGVALGACLHLAVDLRDLNLGENRLGVPGALGLSGGVASLRRLRRLNLSDNRLGREGVAMVGAAVDAAGELEWVGLEGNQVCGAGLWSYLWS